MKKYIIVEQGSYSDYGVSFVDVTNCTITNAEVLAILKIDSWDTPSISGEMKGELVFFDNSSISLKDLKEETKCNINGLFSCRIGRNKEDLTDRIYTKDEVYNFAINNDNSGEDYWKEQVEIRYPKYLVGMEILKKL